MNLDLHDRVALITGASRGIGLASAKTLAAHGAHLVLVARDSDGVLGEQAEAIASEHAVTVQVVCGDVADPGTAKNAVQTAFKQYKRLDMLVNNAGVLQDARIGMIPEAMIDNSMAINVNSVLHFTQAASRLMLRGQSGSIVNISSIIGEVGNSGQMLYGATKAAILGATRSAAKELGPSNIRVNAITPGYIDTQMIKALPPEVDQERRDSIVLGRVGTPEDVASTVLFLCSDLSCYVTGQVIGVNGGMLI